MTLPTITLHPGSDAARKAGCKCPIVDNCYGKGCLGDGEKYGWVMSGDCPLHGVKLDELLREIENEKS